MPQRAASGWLAIWRSCSNNSCSDKIISSSSNEPGSRSIPAVPGMGNAPVILLARLSRRLTNELLLFEAPLPWSDVWLLLKANISPQYDKHTLLIEVYPYDACNASFC